MFLDKMNTSFAFEVQLVISEHIGMIIEQLQKTLVVN